MKFRFFCLLFFALGSSLPVQAEDDQIIYDPPFDYLQCQQPAFTQCMIPCAEQLASCLPTDDEYYDYVARLEADEKAEWNLCLRRHTIVADRLKCEREATQFVLRRLNNYMSSFRHCYDDFMECADKCFDKYCEIVIEDTVSGNTSS